MELNQIENRLKYNIQRDIASLTKITSINNTTTIVLKEIIKYIIGDTIESKKALPENYDTKILILKKLTNKTLNGYMESIINSNETTSLVKELLTMAHIHKG